MMFVRIAATTGARRGEILGLSWADIDLVSGRVRLVRGLIDAAGGPVLQERKTKNANCVDLDVETVELLRVHREQCAKGAAARGVPVQGCPLFSATSEVTASWKPNWVTKRFGVALDHAGVEHFRLHDYADFVATQMLASGVALPVVSARLGRARESTTLNIYAASMSAWDRAAAEVPQHTAPSELKRSCALQRGEWRAVGWPTSTLARAPCDSSTVRSTERSGQTVAVSMSAKRSR